MADGSKSTSWLIAILSAVAVATALWFALVRRAEGPDLDDGAPVAEDGGAVPGDGRAGPGGDVHAPEAERDAAEAGGDDSADGRTEDAGEDSPAEEEPAEEPQTEEERAEAEAERKVEAFDALTDRWREPLPKERRVGLTDIESFARQFKALPAERRDECLHRALNLIPDDNVMVLAGVLLDKSVEQEFVELVFQDVLNRDEACKKPILLEVFKDKTHPCWADAAWILDATGELPSAR